MTRTLVVGETLAEPVYISEQLPLRPLKSPDYQREKLALQELAACLSDGPAHVFSRFVELAMELTGAVSAGLSLYDSIDEPTLFRWQHLRGVLAPFDGATTPRNDSPCGVTLDCNLPVLARHPERQHGWIRDADIEVPEVLLVPLFIGGSDPLGTLWVVAEQEGYFDSGDARIASELAAFVGITLRMSQSEQQLQRLLEEQEIIAHEMSHRLKNIFTMTDSMIRIGARTAETPEAMALALSGRIQALSEAHALVRRKAGSNDILNEGALLADLIEAIVKPHNRADGKRSFSISGPDIECGYHAVNGIALIIQELTTNAVKYGALAVKGGRVAIDWKIDGDVLSLIWEERGGKALSTPPEKRGFGSTLLDRTVASQFRGTLRREWRAEGLRAEMQLSRKRLAD